jgi:energy-converting hydrogenase B subunit D
MTALQVAALLLVAAGGTAVVVVQDPRRQALVAGVFGLCVAILFFLFQAPDVAISQIVVVTVGLPLMLLLTLAALDREEE